jgi:uncharacterized protein (DUF58 family)
VNEGRPGGASGPIRFRRLRVTRDGWYFCLLAIGIGLAALNTGNNLLFLVLGLLLATIILSGILSERSLRDLELRRLLPGDPCAGEPFNVTLCVRNRKRFWPSYDLIFREPDGPVAGAEARVLVVKPQEEISVAYLATASVRGRHPLWRLELRTRFPFGLFEKIRDVSVDDELWVLPERVRVSERRATGGQRDGTKPEGRPGHGEELLGLTELRAGDDRRSVHWRKSAAVGRLLKIERERERRRRITIVLDNRGERRTPAFEHAVAQAAALARLLSLRGIEVGLSTSGTLRPPGPGSHHLRTLMRDLAVVVPVPGGSPPTVPREDAVLRVGEEGADAA